MKTKLYVKEICYSKGMSLKDLADKLNMSQSNLSQILNSKNPTMGVLESIAEGLGVSFIDLFFCPSLKLSDYWASYRDQLAKDLFLKMFDPQKEWDPYNLYEQAKLLANGAVISAMRDNRTHEDADENWDAYENGEAPYYGNIWNVIEFCNGKPINLVGSFSTYKKACEETFNEAKTSVKLMNSDCEKNDKMVAIPIYKEETCDNCEIIVKIEYKDKNRITKDEDEYYEYHVIGVELDTPLDGSCGYLD